MRHAPILTAAVAALALGSVAIASPAVAADLPVGDTIYVIGEDALYTSTSDGTLTKVVDIPAGTVFGADWDSVDQLVYYFTDGDPENPCQLWTLDLATNTPTLVGDLEFNECDALDVASDGRLRIGNDNGLIATINKSDASTISQVTVSIALSWIAQGPGGQFYVGDYPGNLYTLDTTTGDTALVANPTFFWDSADFDSAGTLWVTSRTGPEGCQGVASLSLDDPEGSYLFEGDFLEDGSCIGGYALFIVPPTPVTPPTTPTKLAATGSTASLPLAGIAGIAVLAGMVLLLWRRRTAV